MAALRIGIASHALHAGGGISVGRNLIRSLRKVAPENTYFISFPIGVGYETAVSDIPKGNLAAYSGGGNLLRRLVYEHRQLRPALRKFSPDIVLALGNAAIGLDCPEAILCHRPHLWYPRKHFGVRRPREVLKTDLRGTLQAARLSRALRQPKNILLYQTEVARRRIEQRYGLGASPIHCPNAVSQYLSGKLGDRSLPPQIQRHRSDFKLLYLTRYYPHKNLEAIVQVADRYAQDFGQIVIFITISADQHPGAKRLLLEIERRGLQEQIVNIGPLRQDELEAWYTGCDALLMPTLLESFSGTYLEAMHFGTPILTSDLDFAHEICGDAALYFDPWELSSMRKAILDLKNAPSLADELRVKGREQLAMHQRTWDEIASDLLEQLSARLSEA